MKVFYHGWKLTLIFKNEGPDWIWDLNIKLWKPALVCANPLLNFLRISSVKNKHKLNVLDTTNTCTNDTPDTLHTLHYTTWYSTIVTDVSHTDVPENDNLIKINTNNGK